MPWVPWLPLLLWVIVVLWVLGGALGAGAAEALGAVTLSLAILKGGGGVRGTRHRSSSGGPGD